MKVLLNSDIEHLGEEGKTVTISDGYARNFLLPKKLCLPYTPQNIALIKSRKKAIEERRRQKQEAALSLKERIEKITLSIPVPVGDAGRLFGSVNNATVSQYLAAQGFDISRRDIELAVKHIKVVGKYTAKIKLYGLEYASCAFEVVSDKVSEDVPEAVDTTSQAEVSEVSEATSEESAAEQGTATEEADAAANTVEIAEPEAVESAAESADIANDPKASESASPETDTDKN